MMTEHPRIEELRRRVDKDPTSIAFAQLAEEYRRSGEYLQAVNICRDGLARHPGYVSAQVTLGRALLELGEHAEARRQLEDVLRVAPDNLAAIRALFEIHQRHGDTSERPAPPSLEAADLLVPELPPIPDFNNWTPETDLAMDVPEASAGDPPLDCDETTDPGLEQLEQWLAAIVADRYQAQ